MYQYPYGNAQQLNLDWILGKLQELEAGSGGGSADLEEVANALISASYAVRNYTRSDIVFYNGKLYRANQNITAEAWNDAHWDEILLGDTVANLVRYVGSLNNSQVINSSTVTGAHTSDALNNLASDINGLKDTIDDTQEMISVWIETTSTASRQYQTGDYLIKPPYLYRVTTTINIGETLSGSNLRSARIGEELTSIKQASEFQIQGNNVRAVMKNGIVDFTAVGGFWQDDGTSDHLLQWSSTSTGTYVTVQLPSEIRPYLYTELAVANIARRVTIRPDGYLSTDSTLTVTALRFSGTWIATNAV